MPAGRRRCSRRSGRCARRAPCRRSWRSRPGWRAGSARASAASCRRATAATCACASTGRCSTPTGSWRCRGMVDLCGLQLAHPILNGSGTYDAIAARRAFGDALLDHFPFSAFVSKTITLRPRDGNPPPRLYETPAGMINSIGLPNKGLDGYLAHDLPELARLPVPLITNVMGSTAEEIAALVEAVDARAQIDAIELNVSCP